MSFSKPYVFTKADLVAQKVEQYVVYLEPIDDLKEAIKYLTLNSFERGSKIRRSVGKLLEIGPVTSFVNGVIKSQLDKSDWIKVDLMLLSEKSNFSDIKIYKRINEVLDSAAIKQYRRACTDARLDQEKYPPSPLKIRRLSLARDSYKESIENLPHTLSNR